MFTLDQVVPGGRSFDEYRRMFDLTAENLESTIVGCGDGPASFNAEETRQGRRVVSCDPLYRFEKVRIEQRIGETFDLAPCSHLLFLYSVQLGDAFHRAAVLEMCRVADADSMADEEGLARRSS